ncbi:hypothetical protein ACSBOB_18575 [Mesorhizobium sp. ASY16-5R]|uniref:hypothetical protein n=1 Tax=Mesorhizobium sp. ASY16-5R TaxID=3445772 RepID=UPI003FA0542C
MSDLDPHHRIEEAARFLASTPPQARPKPLLPAMKAMFDLSTIDVVQAIRQSHDIQGGANGCGS